MFYLNEAVSRSLGMEEDNYSMCGCVQGLQLSELDRLEQYLRQKVALCEEQNIQAWQYHKRTVANYNSCFCRHCSRRNAKS